MSKKWTPFNCLLAIVDLKKTLITFCLLILTIQVFAQRNFYKLSLGAGAGTTLTFGDSRKVVLSLSKYGIVDYYFTPYLNLGLEVQKGNLSGGETNNRPFKNSYLSAAFVGKIQLGEFLPGSFHSSDFSDLIKGIYVGGGIGMIKNHLLVPDILTDPIITPDSKEIIVPVTYGLNLKFKNKYEVERFMLNFSVQTVISLADNLDGDPNPASNVNDMYNYFSVGFRYHIGVIGLDRKR